jgi:hypothetical protein
MITIFQIQLTDDQIDHINEHGHDSVPAQHARIKLLMSGSDAWKPEYFQYFTRTVECLADNLEGAFEETNLWNRPETKKLTERVCSSSVGDVFERNGEYFIVDNFGFSQIELNAATAA